MSPDTRLRIDGLDYGGWTRVRIERSLEAIAGTFELSVTDRWPGSVYRPIKPAQVCAVEVDGAVVITGHVDDVEPSYDAERREVTVRGRDATGDLVDCAVLAEPGEWKNQRMEQIATLLCDPFGISVTAAVATGEPIAAFRVEPGMTAFEALEALARMRGVLLQSDGQGGLTITRVGTARVATVLERGVNILALDAVFSTRELFSRYVAKGQAAGTDLSWGKAAAEPQGQAFDSTVPRYRPLVVVAERPGDIASLRTRAEWERAVRVARSVQATVTVQGWSHADGLWEPGVRVVVRDEWAGIDEELLLAGVTYLLDDGGTRAELALTRPEAYDVLAEPEATESNPWLAAS